MLVCNVALLMDVPRDTTIFNQSEGIISGTFRHAMLCSVDLRLPVNVEIFREHFK